MTNGSERPWEIVKMINSSEQVWTIEDVMRFTGLGRRIVTRIFLLPDCPTLPRKKGQKYLIRKEAFLKWWCE